jgi:translocator protein
VGSRRADVLGVVGVVAVTAAVAVIGGGGGDFRSDWYARLRKPSWQPSGRTIGTVWSVLYVTIATSGSLLWVRRRRAGVALAPLFIAQSVLNAAWTPLFTRARRLDLAVADCAALAAVNAALIVSAWRTSRPASALLVPYAAWTAFATFLSWTIYVLNRGPKGAGRL